MNRCADEAPAHVEKGARKRKCDQVDQPKALNGSNYLRSQGAVDRFGAINVLSAENFGALGGLKDYSTGSCTPDLEQYNIIQSGKHSQGKQTKTFPTWSTNYTEDSDNEGTSRSCPSSSISADLAGDLSSHSNSISSSCTLHESTSSGSPPLKLFCPPQAQHNVHETLQIQPYFPQHYEFADVQNITGHNDSDQGVNASWTLPRTQYRYSVDPTRIATLDELPRPPVMRAESSENDAQDPNYDQNDRVRLHYRFASADLEASLLQHMEDRQRIQDETHEAERCSHVISPEDLIWGSVKHYCGMVLDRETSSLLGTAVLFISQEQDAEGSSPAAAGEVPKSAWVTCVKAVEGRTEVLIKNSRGGIHVAQLLLTSAALGLALYSVNVWQGTFALAFLSRVTGPASVPHRLFVDVERSDRVYVIGYEEPWEFESATLADARVRPGRIVDAGRHTVVGIDFTTGRLGGSIASPAGFRGGLVVRADGLLAGVVTGEVWPRHRTNIDFSSAYNVYSLLEEL